MKVAGGVPWHWEVVNADAGKEGLYHDPSLGVWWALATGGDHHDPLFFQASHIEQKFGAIHMLVQLRYSFTGLPTVAVASGRIDSERDNDRRGLALSALEQLDRVGLPIPLAELRRLLDGFVADVVMCSQSGQEARTGPQGLEVGVLDRERW